MCRFLRHMVLMSSLLWVLMGGAAGPSFAAEDPQSTHNSEDGEHAEKGPITAEPADVDLAVWSLVVFLVFLWLLKVIAWKPLTRHLDQRELRIRQDIADAEAARVKAEQMLAQHAARLDQVQDEVREIIAEARRDAEHTKQDIIATAEREAESMRHRAVTDIHRARDQALKELFDQMSARVAEATEHVLGRALTDGDQDRFIEEALAEIGGNSR